MNLACSASTADEQSRMNWIHDVRTALEADGIGWAMWDYRGSFGVVRKQDGQPAQVDEKVVEALGLEAIAALACAALIERSWRSSSFSGAAFVVSQVSSARPGMPTSVLRWILICRCRQIPRVLLLGPGKPRSSIHLNLFPHITHVPDGSRPVVGDEERAVDSSNT